MNSSPKSYPSLSLNKKSSYKDSQFLLKYAPKYHYSLTSDLSELRQNPLRTKTKHIKVLKSVKTRDYIRSNKSLWLSLLKSQRQNIKALSIVNPGFLRHFPKLYSYQLDLQKPDSWRTLFHLTNIKQLTLEILANFHAFNQNKTPLFNKLQQRFLRHLLKLKTLKYFHINLCNKLDPNLHNLLFQINNLGPFLNSIEAFYISFNRVIISDDTKIDFFNIYKNTKNLVLLEVPHSSIQKTLDHLTSFQNIQSLSIQQIATNPFKNKDILDISFMSNFNQLTTLQKIDISLQFDNKKAFKNFLCCFTLPQTLKSLRIGFKDVCWEEFDPIMNTEDISYNYFSTDNLFNGFYQKWEKLSNLETLSLIFTESASKSIRSTYFIEPLLKRLESLKEFHYADWGNIEGNAKKSIDFNILWQALTHLNNSLTEIIIESFSISLRNLQEPLIGHFMKLERLCIRGFIIGNLNVKEKAKSEKGLYLEVERLVTDDEKSFYQALEMMNNCSRDVSIAINLDVRKINSLIFNQDSLSLMKKILKQKTIKLKITNFSQQIKPETLQVLGSIINPDDSKLLLGHLIVISKSGKKLFSAGKPPVFQEFIDQGSIYLQKEQEEDYGEDEDYDDEEEEEEDSEMNLDMDFFESLGNDGFDDIEE